MRALILSVTILLTGCGDLGSSSVVTSSDQAQDQNNQQSQNEPELNCNVECSVTADDRVTASKSCDGSAPFAVSVLSLDECDSVSEVGSESAAAAG